MESRTPFLSLDEAHSEGPGETCDLGTVLARHSLVAWIAGFKANSNSNAFIHVVLEVSHDGIHWHGLGTAPLTDRGHTNGWPSDPSVAIAWPARYVRASITRWTEAVTGGLVSATVASV